MFYCFLADGFEETEAIAPIDILRRAGVPVTTVGLGEGPIRGSHNVYVVPDMPISEFKPDSSVEGIILPGGMPGTKNLDAHPTVAETVRFCEDRGLYLCAICAAPSVLGHLGVLNGRKATCFPGFESELTGAEALTDKVVTDGSVITAKGAGCAIEFGLAIVSAVCGDETAQKLASAMQCG